MDYFIEFIKNWGYVAVFLGSLVEGESVILVSCFMAHLGYLSLTKIMITAFCGTLLADQTLYYVGRYYGQTLIQRFHRLHAPANRAFALLHRWDVWFILSNRFIWGIRTISPVVIGASGIRPQRFTPLNLIAALAWTLISCIGAYMLAGVLEDIGLEQIKKYFIFFTTGLILFIVAFIFVKRWLKRRFAEMEEEGPFHD